MRFFIFPFENIYIAVAADNVKRFISPDSADSPQENCKDPVKIQLHSAGNNGSRHGIVLKQETNDNETIILITPPVEKDIDVAEKEIQSLPKSFAGIYASFNGIYFNEHKIIFFLDTEKLTGLWLNKPWLYKPKHKGQVLR